MDSFAVLQTMWLSLAPLFAGCSLFYFALAGRSGAYPGLKLWAYSFLCTCVGFLVWSLTPRGMFPFFLLGDSLQVASFALLGLGAGRIVGLPLRPWHLAAWVIMLAIWIWGHWLLGRGIGWGMICLQPVRTFVTLAAGVWLLQSRARPLPLGLSAAGWSLILWSMLSIVFLMLLHHPARLAVLHGFAVTLHLTAALGVIMGVLELTRRRAEASEARAERLEGLLPICSQCKRIRTKGGYWEPVEKFVSERSGADFSHDLCPDCLRRLYPDIAQRLEAKGRL